MNKIRRFSVENIQLQLQEILEELEMIRDEEQQYYDNIPESLQLSTRAKAACAASNNLNSAYDYLQKTLEYLEDAKA